VERPDKVARKRILVSESRQDECMAVFLRAVLEPAGYLVRVSLDPLETLDLARSWRPDLITTDLVKPPPISGLDVIRRLKADEATKHIPVVVISATIGRVIPADANHTEFDGRARALEAGAAAVIAKPADEEGVLHTVSDVLGR
jgi:two-component system, cell cycle response regulator